MEKKKLRVVCNMCGRELKTENGLLMEDAFEAAKEWGYFSKKDLELHKFYLSVLFFPASSVHCKPY